MILFAARCAFAILIIGTAFIFWKLVRKQLSMKNALLAVAIHICVAVVLLLTAVPHIPPLTDNVTITATGEKGAEAQAEEVFLKGYTVDDVEYIALDSMEITDGHWFWIGDNYCWRAPSDHRQPEGVTESITFKIPVGWSRTLNFSSGVWMGFAEISVGSNTWVVDTSMESAASIGRSSTNLLIWNQIVQILIYGILLILMMLMELLIVKKRDLAKANVRNNSGKVTYASIAAVVGVVMILKADSISLWVDEMSQIGFTNGTIWEAVGHCLQMREVSPPLPLILSTIWYHIAPYGETWLLLPSILTVVSAIYIIGITGEKIYGKLCGVTAVILAACSINVWTNMAYEYRAYPVYFFFAALTLCYFVACNIDGANNNKNYVLYSVAMLCLAMSHYFGMVACIELLVADMFLFRNKRITRKKLYAYFIPGAAMVLWAFSILIARNGSLQSLTWQPIPTMSLVRTLLQYLVGNADIGYWLLLLSIALGIVYSVSLLLKKNNNFSWKSFHIVVMTVMLVGTIGAFYIYGKAVAALSTMWSNRYFAFLIPVAVLLVSMSISELCSWCGKYREKLGSAIQIFICLYFGINCIVSVQTIWAEPYRQSADWIYAHGNYVYNDDTLVLSTTGGEALEGWNEYYLTRQGRRDSVNVSYCGAMSENEILSYSRIFIQYAHGTTVDAVTQSVLDKHFNMETDNKDVCVKVYVRK